MRSTSGRGSRATSTKVRLPTHQIAASCPSTSDQLLGARRFRQHEQRHRAPFVAIHDVRDLAFAVEARARADQLEPGARRILRQLHRASRIPTPSSFRPPPASDACRARCSWRSTSRDRPSARRRARAPTGRSPDTRTRRRRRAPAMPPARTARCAATRCDAGRSRAAVADGPTSRVRATVARSVASARRAPCTVRAAAPAPAASTLRRARESAYAPSARRRTREWHGAQRAEMLFDHAAVGVGQLAVDERRDEGIDELHS